MLSLIIKKRTVIYLFFFLFISYYGGNKMEKNLRIGVERGGLILVTYLEHQTKFIVAKALHTTERENKL